MRAARYLLLGILTIGCHYTGPVRARADSIGASAVGDLPLVTMAPAHPHTPLAVLITGDGGWRAIDRSIARGLHDRGYGIVGLVAPRYFAVRRTPDEASDALRRILQHYTADWQSDKAVVIGYSRGAGVAPFMVNRLPEPWRDEVTTIALVGLDKTIDFEVTPFDLLRTHATPREIPVRGEVEKLQGKHVLCFFGVKEDTSLCRELPNSLITAIAEPGSHHFAGNYDDLARTIWRRVQSS